MVACDDGICDGDEVCIRFGVGGGWLGVCVCAFILEVCGIDGDEYVGVERVRGVCLVSVCRFMEVGDMLCGELWWWAGIWCGVWISWME